MGSSSSAVIGKGCTIDGYKTVTINGVTWMAENYNCNVSGSKCGNKFGRLTDNSDDFAEYGRLYDWVTVMGFDATCNSTNCTIDTPHHQGICPNGWHVPTNDEWDALYLFADAGTDPYSSNNAGKHLKAESGWDSYPSGTNMLDGNGLDTYGFAALPGGKGDYGDQFLEAGRFGYWWTASDYDLSYYYNAHNRSMTFNNNVASAGNSNKNNFFSLRCVADVVE